MPINETITDNDSPYMINLYPVEGEVTINVAAYTEDDGGGLGACTAEEITVTFEDCTELCNNGIDDDGDGLTDCDDPDCAFSANAGNDKDIDYGTSGDLYGSASGSEEPYSYAWTPNTDIDDNTAQVPAVNPSSQTTYTLTATDAYGCTATDDVIVYVDGDGADPLLYPCGWDSNGKPNCLETTTLNLQRVIFT